LLFFFLVLGLLNNFVITKCDDNSVAQMKQKAPDILKNIYPENPNMMHDQEKIDQVVYFLQNRQDILDIYNEEIKLCEVSGQGEGVCDKQRLDKMYKDQIDAVTKEEEKFRTREDLLKTTFNQDCYLTPLQSDYEKKRKRR